MNSKQNGQHTKPEDFAAKRKRLKRTVGIGASALAVVLVIVGVAAYALGMGNEKDKKQNLDFYYFVQTIRDIAENSSAYKNLPASVGGYL